MILIAYLRRYAAYLYCWSTKGDNFYTNELPFCSQGSGYILNRENLLQCKKILTIKNVPNSKKSYTIL